MMEKKMQTNGMKGLVCGTLAPCLTTNFYFYFFHGKKSFASAVPSLVGSLEKGA